MMISSADLYTALRKHDVKFYTGVPDSLLKSFCAYISATLSPDAHVIAANEGNAVGIAIGHYLATGEIPVVYMQNSGLGNTVNPLLSLADPEVYGIPMLFLVGWRGKPGIHDEPQHVKQGRVMLPMLDAMEVRYYHIGTSKDSMQSAVNDAMAEARRIGGPIALIAEKGAFSAERLDAPVNDYDLTRESAIQTVADLLPKSAAIVSTTGMASRELFESRAAIDGDHSHDFLTVGGMGHASQIALGIASKQGARTVVCIDGDGAVLMHMGGLAVIAQQAPANLVHILLNNGAHASVGGQPTAGFDIDITSIANACGYRTATLTTTLQELVAALNSILGTDGPHFLEIRIRQGHRKDLGRPTRKPSENKGDFMSFLETGS